MQPFNTPQEVPDMKITPTKTRKRVKLENDFSHTLVTKIALLGYCHWQGNRINVDHVKLNSFNLP